MDTLENENVIPEAQTASSTTPPQEQAHPAPQAAPQPAPANPYWNVPRDVEPGTSQNPYIPNAPQQQPQYPPQEPAGYYHYRYTQQPQQGGYYPPRYQQPQSQPRPCNPQSWNGYAPPVPPTVPPMPPKSAPVPPRAPRKHAGSFWKGLVAAVLVIALVAGGCFATGSCVTDYWRQQNDALTASFNNQLAQMQKQIDDLSSGSGLTVSGNSGSYAPTGDTLTPAQVYNQNVQSVVAISSTVTTTIYGQSTTGTATGSGFIVTSDGYVVTNYHVVDGAIAITVTTNNGTNYEATLVGGDENNDVAVLKVEGSNLPAVTIGHSDSLIVGDQVAAIGNPLGTLTNTLTVGYISARDRAVTTDSFAVNMLQTDAAINSGNSGGPLFNMYGEVVGITSAKYSGESSSGATIEGIGFAIPIDDVIDLIEALITDGFVSSGYLGVSVSDYSSGYAGIYGLPESTPTGAVIREIVAGYSADRAGLQVNDVVVALGDYTVTGVTSLTSALRHYGAGETTTITVYRGGQQLSLTITMDEKPAETATAEPPTSGSNRP